MSNNDGGHALREEVQMNDIGLMVAGIVGLITYLIMTIPSLGFLPASSPMGPPRRWSDGRSAMTTDLATTGPTALDAILADPDKLRDLPVRDDGAVIRLAARGAIGSSAGSSPLPFMRFRVI